MKARKINIIMRLKKISLSKKIFVLCGALGMGTICFTFFISSEETAPPQVSTEPAKTTAALDLTPKPKEVKGIHLSAWIAGAQKARLRIKKLFDETELNAVVIAVKEYEGEVYIPGVPLVTKYGLYVNAIPDLASYIADYKKRGIYTIARIVVFKDTNLTKKRPDLAVKKPDGTVWTDHRGFSWSDPYSKQVWEYNFSIASAAIQLGFSEIQFDYIRYPSDGDLKLCRYSFQHHSASSAVNNLNAFIKEARARFKPLGANLSIAVFGLTTSVSTDMGIGQKIVNMTEWADFVSPMVYPSHYAKGEYGLPDPNSEPYKVVAKSMRDAQKKLGSDSVKLRPYLQDFSLGHKYGPKEVRAQILACENSGVTDWLLWDPNCRYTQTALKSKSGVLDPLAQVPDAMLDRVKVSSNTAAIPPSTETPTAPELKKSTP